MTDRTGNPVAEDPTEPKMRKRSRPLDDPMLRVEEFSYNGPVGQTANEDIDRTVYDV